MKIIERLKTNYSSRWLVPAWRKIVPHITVSRCIDGVIVYFDLNNNIDDFTRSDLLSERELAVTKIADRIDGQVWDVGSNIGLFAVRSCVLNRKVIAFDISTRACNLLSKTAQRNKFSLEIVNRPLSVASYEFLPATTSCPTESVHKVNQSQALSSASKSITYEEAASKFGIPALIKMDIEGGEKEFLMSTAWKEWLIKNSVFWLLEIHPRVVEKSLLWQDVPYIQIDEYHYLYHGDRQKIQELCVLNK